MFARLVKIKILVFLILISRHQSVQNAESLSNFSCIPSELKLLEIGVSSRFYNIIKNMYSYSTSCVKINDKLTEFFATKLGVKQGDNLNPNLFKIFINDLPDTRCTITVHVFYDIIKS
jgi:hypothetical protein